MSMPVARVQAALLLSAASGMGVSLALTVAAGRRADAAGFAVFALVGAFVALARDLLDLGTTAVTVRSALADPAGEGRALEQLLAWRLAMALPLALAALVYAALAGDVAGRLALGLTALTVLAMHSNGLIAAFQLRERLDIPALVNIAAQAATLALAAALWARLDRPLAAAALVLGRELLIVALNHAAVRRLLGQLPHVRWRDLRPGLLASATSRYAAAAFAFHAILHSGTFLLRWLVPVEAFAGYAAAFRLMTPAFSLPWLLTAPLVPALVRLAGDGSGFRAHFAGQWLPAMTVAAALAAAGAVAAPDIVGLVYGGRYLAGVQGAVVPMRWLMLAFTGVAAAALRAPALLALGWEDGLLRLAAAAAALTIITMVPLGLVFGAEGAAAAIALGALAAGWFPVGPAPARARFGLAPVIAAPLAALAAAAVPSGPLRVPAAGLAALVIGLALARGAGRPAKVAHG